jgi:ABC-type polysaccharide/polyol phosphate export permease
LCALFCAAFGSVCCLLTGNTGSCGVLSFSVSLVFLALSGGILPPVLMPQTMKQWMHLSPITWLRSLMASAASDCDMPQGQLAALAALSAGLILFGILLYRHRAAGKEVEE